MYRVGANGATITKQRVPEVAFGFGLGLACATGLPSVPIDSLRRRGRGGVVSDESAAKAFRRKFCC